MINDRLYPPKIIRTLGPACTPSARCILARWFRVAKFKIFGDVDLQIDQCMESRYNERKFGHTRDWMENSVVWLPPGGEKLNDAREMR